jgi:hypothetical protein
MPPPQLWRLEENTPHNLHRKGKAKRILRELAGDDDDDT